MKTQGNDTIYPTVESGSVQGNHVMECTREGLTKREYFAALAMQGMLSAGDGDFSYDHHIRIAKLSVAHAGTLIEALNKEATHE